MNWKELEEKLLAPFDMSDIEWRIQQAKIDSTGNPKAQVLCYITNRAIMERLDSVFGINGWKNEYVEWHGSSQLCGISAWDDEKKEWITKWDGADNTHIESTKGGLSDSMKRCAVQWGIGRYLYKSDRHYANFNENGEFFTKIKSNNKWYKWDAPKKITFKGGK